MNTHRLAPLALLSLSFGCSNSSGTPAQMPMNDAATSVDAKTNDAKTSDAKSTGPHTDASGRPKDASTGDGSGSKPDGANIGLACAMDSDCGGGLTCIQATDTSSAFGGGPANGYCSFPCKQDSDCPGQSAACVMPSGATKGSCVDLCAVGPALMFVNDPISNDGKCNMRDDVVCTPITSDGTVFGCLPRCGEDSQCPTGLHCDARQGVCVASPSQGDPTGAACDPNATSPTCAGICVGLTGADGGIASSLCSSSCVLGGDDAYLTTPACGGLTHGICLLSPQGNGAGDFGDCAPACLTQSDCAQFPTFVCTALPGLTGTAPGNIPNGFCLGGTPCPNGAADCSALMGTSCVQTTGGPLCLSSGIPLGSEAPDAGVGDAGVGDASNGG